MDRSTSSLKPLARRAPSKTPTRRAWGRFATILDELCTELPLLRADPRVAQAPRGAVARRMAAAVAPFRSRRFLTPMAAVAGAVAEEVLEAMTTGRQLARAYVNNGGDIALHLAPSETFAIGMIDRPDRPSLVGRATIGAADRVRGVATSGWRGRSFSLGVADAVTVLATSAALADAAATLIANAVDLPGHSAIRRTPACGLDPQSDLGERRVTVAVGPLTADEIGRALAVGVAEGELWRELRTHRSGRAKARRTDPPCWRPREPLPRLCAHRCSQRGKDAPCLRLRFASK